MSQTQEEAIMTALGEASEQAWFAGLSEAPGGRGACSMMLRRWEPEGVEFHLVGVWDHAGQEHARPIRQDELPEGCRVVSTVTGLTDAPRALVRIDDPAALYGGYFG